MLRIVANWIPCTASDLLDTELSVFICSGSECKELLASLGCREVAQALDDPALIVTLAKDSNSRWKAGNLAPVKCIIP